MRFLRQWLAVRGLSGLDEAGARDALCDGDLGQAIQAEYLSKTMAQAFTTRKDDDLPRAVRERFGQGVFRERVASVLTALTDPNW